MHLVNFIIRLSPIYSKYIVLGELKSAVVVVHAYVK